MSLHGTRVARVIRCVSSKDDLEKEADRSSYTGCSESERLCGPLTIKEVLENVGSDTRSVADILNGTFKCIVSKHKEHESTFFYSQHRHRDIYRSR